MTKEVINGGIAAVTTVGAVAADSLFNTMGVIFMGAFGGALFALLNQSSMTLASGMRFVGARWLLSQFCSWPAMLLVQRAIGEASFNVPQTALLLFVSFVVACPREFMNELAPLRDVVVRIWPRAKE